MSKNIYHIAEDLESFSKNETFSVSQQQFFTQLFHQKSGHRGWRSFDEIINAPRIERKLGRIEAQLRLDIHKLSNWNIIKKYQLTRILGILTDSSLSLSSKIRFILDKRKHTSTAFFSLEFEKRMREKLPWGNEIDHLVEAISKELQQTSLFEWQYRKTLYELRSQLDGLSQRQTKNWVDAEQHYSRHHQRNEIFFKTTHTYAGDILLPAHQAQDYRLGDSEGGCFGYVMCWGKSLLENTHFYGLHADSPAMVKPIHYTLALAKRDPGLNHMMPLTSEISHYQTLQPYRSRLLKALNTPEKTYHIRRHLWKSEFNPSLESVATQLIQTAEKTNGIVLLYLNAYLSSHIVSFCKKNNLYHFFDANFGWLRWKNPKAFQAWLPFYLQHLSYTKHIAEYSISTLQRGPSPATTAKPSTFVFLRKYIQKFRFYVIRGFFYAYFHGVRMLNEWFNKKEEPASPSFEQQQSSYTKMAEDSYRPNETKQRRQSNPHPVSNLTSLWSTDRNHEPSTHSNMTPSDKPYLRH